MAINIDMLNKKTHQKEKNKEKLSSIPQMIINSPEKEKILQHWDKIPAIKETYEPSTFKLMSQGFRSQILDLFREGIAEYDPNSGKPIFRHAFSAKEILLHIQKEFGAKITLQNIYFHLSKLEDVNLIMRIASIKKGRHSTHYFGRTARLFIQVDNPEKDDFLNDEKIQKVRKLLEKLNPSLSIEEHVQSFTELKESMRISRDKIRKWMEDNEKIILELNIDFRDIYEILFLIDRFDPSAIESALKIAKLFKYPQ